jgi:hypothetical protein
MVLKNDLAFALETVENLKETKSIKIYNMKVRIK